MTIFVWADVILSVLRKEYLLFTLSSIHMRSRRLNPKWKVSHNVTVARHSHELLVLVHARLCYTKPHQYKLLD